MHTHIKDNGITSSVSRVIVLDSDERGMSRNTFSFPLKGKLWGRGSCLDSMVCVQGKLWRLNEGLIHRDRKGDDDVIGYLQGLWLNRPHWNKFYIVGLAFVQFCSLIVSVAVSLSHRFLFMFLTSGGCINIYLASHTCSSFLFLLSSCLFLTD